jgi:NTE family protein
VVLAPVTQAFRRSQRVATQVAALGADVRAIAVSPDRAAKRAIGRNVLDPANRAAAARAGRQQAHAAAPSIAVIWHGL